jgi:two-component system chemotaxis family response regulator WspR
MSEASSSLHTPADPPAYQIMVLLVDDQAMVGEAIRRQLCDLPDINFHYCADGQKALQQAVQIRPTVILQDLVMPNVDGLTLVHQFRGNPATKNIPIIVLSTKEDPAIKGEAFSVGANDYLVKLPDKVELIARIRYHSRAYLNQIQRDEAYSALRKSQMQLVDSNTALTALNQKLEELASRDSLTKLLNRSRLEPMLQESVARAKTDGPGAVLYIDLDNFKIVNDTLGHSAGDRLLIRVAALLSSNVSADNAIIRFGGDEFVVIFRNMPAAEAGLAAERLRACLETFRFTEEGKTFPVNASIGLALIDGKLESAAVLAAADSACYAAKAGGRNRVELYRPEELAMTRLIADTNWATQIKAAMQSGTLQLWFQPVVSLASRKICHEEVFVRYYDETNKVMVRPGAFLRAVERSGQGIALDRHVIHQAFQALADHPKLEISINILGPSFVDPTLPLFIEEEAYSAGINLERVIFEIPESVVVANIEQARQAMGGLQPLGCRFALDDFGSNLSSLSYLKNLPVAFLKIEGPFIRDLTQQPLNKIPVRAIQETAKILKMETVAKWVENAKTLQQLTALDVDCAQGTHFFEPSPRPTME